MNAPQEASPQKEASQKASSKEEAPQEADQRLCQACGVVGSQAVGGGAQARKTPASEKTLKLAFWAFEGVSCAGVAAIAYMAIQMARHALR